MPCELAEVRDVVSAAAWDTWESSAGVTCRHLPAGHGEPGSPASAPPGWVVGQPQAGTVPVGPVEVRLQQASPCCQVVPMCLSLVGQVEPSALAAPGLEKLESWPVARPSSLWLVVVFRGRGSKGKQ